MITIGLVGGVASGKSIVALDFQKLGAFVLNGDQVGHEVLGVDSVIKKLVERWGSRVSQEQGQLDRSAIAKIVFGKKSRRELKFLESVTHPEIEKRLTARLVQLEQLGRFQVAVLDAAVMLKAGWDSMCDQIVFVDAPLEIRERRAQLRRQNNQQLAAREAAQTTVGEKKKRADIIIDNSGSPQKTFKHVEKVWQSLLQIA
jgi:dephospho-CoA kinase